MSDAKNGQELHPTVLELARGRNFAALTTMLPDGHPQTQVMWVDADDQHILINTEVHRQKFRNVERDPRVTVTIWDKEDPYRFVEVRGEVVEKVTGPTITNPKRTGGAADLSLKASSPHTLLTARLRRLTTQTYPLTAS